MSPRLLAAMAGAGLASVVNPCVLALVPGWVGAVVAGAPTRWHAAGATLRFVLGFGLAFAALGAAAGAAGTSLDGLGRWLTIAGGVVAVLCGLVVLGVPGPWQGERRLLDPAALQTAGPVALGVAFAAAWTPCVGPLLGAALTTAAVEGGALRGSVLLLAYTAGLAVPFLVASLLAASWPATGRRLRSIGPVLHRMAGGALVVVGVLLVLDIRPLPGG